MPILIDVLALVSQPPIGWICHLVILASLEVPAAITFSDWRRGPPSGEPGGRRDESARLAFGAVGLFLLRLIPIVAALLTEGDDVVVTPPLDRAVSALTTLFLIWVFAFPEPLRQADAALAGLSFGVLAALGVTWGLWAQEVAAGAAYYNRSVLETNWEIANILLLVGGIGLFSRRRKPYWSTGLWLLALLLAGHMAHYLFPFGDANVPGAVRLVEVIGLPLATTVFYRRAGAARPAVGAVGAVETALPHPLPQKSPLRQVFETFLITAVFYVAIDLTLGRFQVDGPSMEPSLYARQYLLVDKVSYLLSKPQRGDIVVFHHPLRPERDLIKRIIGLPGETILIESGVVSVNGQRFEEPYVSALADYSGLWTLGTQQYFVLGDNRNISSDSHLWGPVDRGQLIGRAIFIYWPPLTWGPVYHYTYANPP
ncbi:MAG TPA: signal peptidase I [Anaerolineales bacterium]|nr:signal peptidase I [Anaerolineales bacterium]